MARHSKKKQITNFITTGQELEVYRNERDDNEDDDELDDLTERFANSSFIYDDGDLEENLERTVATCDEGYGEYFESNGCFANGDDQESFYPSAGDFYEEDYNLNAHCAINQPNSQFLFNSDQHNNFESQSSPEPTSSFYWTPSNEASCSFADQTQPFHESPIEEEKLTGLELVPYESEDDENDWPTNCRFNPEFDFDDDSQIKENLFGADQDDYHDDLLEIYKKEFRDNFPELFTKKKKRKEKKANLRDLLDGEESVPQKRPKCQNRPCDEQFQLDNETPLPSQTIEQEVFEDHLTVLPDSAFEDLFE